MFKKLSFKKRSLLLVEALIFALVAWGLISIPSSLLNILGIVAWCVVGLLLLYILGTYCLYKEKHWLCFLVCFLLTAGSAWADIAYIQVEPMDEGEDQCRVVARARTETEGGGEITQTEIDSWVEENSELFAPFQCNCKKDDTDKKSSESAVELMKQRRELENQKPWTDEQKKQAFELETKLVINNHCKMYEGVQGCKTPRQYVDEDQKDCYTCMFVGLAITATDIMASLFEEYVSQHMVIVLALCFCMWLMWMVARCLIGIDDGVTFVGAILSKVLWFVAIVLLLQQPLSWVLDLVTVPFAQVSGWVVQSVSDATSLGTLTSPIAVESETAQQGDYCTAGDKWDSSKYLKYIPRYQQSDSVVSVLSPQLKNAIMCPVQNNFTVVISSLAIGQTLQCWAYYRNSGNQAEDEAEGSVFPDLNLALAGLLLMISSYFLMFLVPFFMIEVVLRMALFFVPFPIWCLALMYKPSRGFASRAFLVFIHALLCLVTLSIAAAFITEAYVAVIAPTQEVADIIKDALSSTVANDKANVLSNLFSISKNFKMVVIFVTLSWFAYKILALSVLFADKILGTALGSAASAFGAGVHKSLIVVRDTIRNAITGLAKLAQ